MGVWSRSLKVRYHPPVRLPFPLPFELRDRSHPLPCPPPTVPVRSQRPTSPFRDQVEGVGRTCGVPKSPSSRFRLPHTDTHTRTHTLRYTQRLLTDRAPTHTDAQTRDDPEYSRTHPPTHLCVRTSTGGGAPGRVSGRIGRKGVSSEGVGD